MSKRTQAEMEAAYDAERSGAAWLKVQAITDDPTDDGRDIPLSTDEAQIIERILAQRRAHGRPRRWRMTSSILIAIPGALFSTLSRRRIPS
jgi:hypothetical protein